MRDIMAQMLALLPPPRKLRHIGLGLSVVILLPFLMLACAKQPGAKQDLTKRTAPRRPKTTDLPQPEQKLLGSAPYGCFHSVLSIMEHLAGYADMEGSGLYPGTLTTKPGKYGSYRIAWTLNVKPGSVLSYDASGLFLLAMAASAEEIPPPLPQKDITHAGLTVFRFWLSHDGSRMKLPVIPFSSPSEVDHLMIYRGTVGDNRFAYIISAIHPDGCVG